MAYEVTEITELFIQDMEQYREVDKTKGLIENCSTSPIIFAERILGVKLYAWQVKFLKELLVPVNSEQRSKEQKEFVAITSRQIGKSTLLAIFSIWCCVFNKVPATTYNNTTVGISSASDVQAKKLLLEMKKYIRLGDVYVRETYKQDGKSVFGDKLLSSLLDDNEANNTTTITFKAQLPEHGEFFLKGSKSGSTIKSYAATTSVLGETFSVVVIDEAGMTDRISDIFFKEYMYPTGNSTHAIRIYTSTPWVPQGFFYRMVDPDNIYGGSPAMVLAFTIDAIKLENEDYYNTVMKKVEQLNADGDYNEAQRAYYCRFVKGEQSYFDPNNIMAMFDDSLYKKDSFAGTCDMGVDFGGQVTSKTVITISTLDDIGNIIRLYDKVYDVNKDNTLIDDIAELMKLFKVERVVVDDCPAGIYMIRIMEDEKGWNVSRFNFRSEKVKKYGGFRSMLKKHKILSYPDDKLKTEMLAMEFSNGSRQSVLQHAPGYSDDMIDSFVMSCTHYIQEEGGFKTFSIKGDDNGKIYDKKEILCPRKRSLQGIRRRENPFAE